METKHTYISVVQHLSLAPLVKTKRMMLVLDLDHTLINSTNLEDLSSDEGYLLHQISTKKGTFCLLLFARVSGMGKGVV